jgi:hypothetical protein
MDTDWNEEAAARAAIRDEVERVLRKASEGVDIDAVHRRPYIAQGLDQQGRFKPCVGGPCQGGRKLCPSPEACELVGSDDDALSAARGIIVGIAGALAIWAGAAALWLSLR